MRPRCCLTRSKEPVPHLGETPTWMPYIRAPCLGLDETGQTRCMRQMRTFAPKVTMYKYTEQATIQ
jgi:hypothetical protein